MTGRIFDATEALEAGLVRELLPAPEVRARAVEIANEIAEHTAPVSVALTRQMMWRLLGAAPDGGEPARVTQALLALGGTHDAAEEWRRSSRSGRPFTVASVDMPAFCPWWVDESFE